MVKVHSCEPKHVKYTAPADAFGNALGNSLAREVAEQTKVQRKEKQKEVISTYKESFTSEVLQTHNASGAASNAVSQMAISLNGSVSTEKGTASINGESVGKGSDLTLTNAAGDQGYFYIDENASVADGYRLLEHAAEFLRGSENFAANLNSVTNAITSNVKVDRTSPQLDMNKYALGGEEGIRARKHKAKVDRIYQKIKNRPKRYASGLTEDKYVDILIQRAADKQKYFFETEHRTSWDEFDAWNTFTALFDDQKQGYSFFSTKADEAGAYAETVKFALEAGPRNQALAMVSQALNQPVNSLRADFLKNPNVPLGEVGKTYAPLTNAKSFTVLSKLADNPLYKGATTTAKVLPGAYAAIQIGEEVAYAVEYDLPIEQASLNVGSRALGTAAELGGGAVFIGESIAAGGAVGALFGGVGALPGAIIGGVVGTVAYTFGGIGTAVNNAVTNSTRTIIGWFQ